MKTLDDVIEAIATAVAKKVAVINGKAKPAAAKAKADDEAGGDEAGEGDGSAEDDFEAGAGDEAGDEAGDAPDRDAVKAALTAVSKKHGQDAAMAILKKTGGVGALSKLAEDKFAAVIKAANAKAK